MQNDYTGTSKGTDNGLNITPNLKTVQNSAPSLNTSDYSTPKVSSSSSTTSTNTNTDILWRNSATGENVAWFMNGTTLSSSQDTLAIPNQNWQIVGTGDFNNDGKTDILWRNSATGEDVVWFMNGTTISSTQDIFAVPNQNWQIAGTGDFNKDGNTDILWRNKATGEDVVWLMDGTTLSSAQNIFAVPNQNWQIAGTGDFNKDGNTDILWRNKATGEDVVWLMNGTTLSSAQDIFAVPNQNWQIVGTGQFNTIAPGPTKATALDLGTITSYNNAFNEFVGNAAPNEYYKFTVSNLTELNLSRTVSSGNNPNVNLLDSSGNNPIGLTSKDFSFDYRLNPGTYYIQVTANNSDSNYTLNLSTTPITANNNGQTLGSAINIGTINTNNTNIQDFVGHAVPNEYYKFTIGSLSEFNLSESVSSGNKPNVNLLDSLDDNLTGIGYYDSNKFSYSLNPGTYYIQVTPNNSDTYYTLNLSTTLISESTGQTPSTARDLGTITSNPTSVQDFVGYAVAKDYYKFTISSLSEFNLSESVSSGNKPNVNLLDSLYNNLTGIGYYDSNKWLFRTKGC